MTNFVTGKDESSKRSTKDLEHLEDDLTTLNQISELVSSLHVSHSVIDEAIKEVHNGIQRQLSEKQLATEPHLATIDLVISTQSVGFFKLYYLLLIIINSYDIMISLLLYCDYF